MNAGEPVLKWLVPAQSQVRDHAAQMLDPLYTKKKPQQKQIRAVQFSIAFPFRGPICTVHFSEHQAPPKLTKTARNQSNLTARIVSPFNCKNCLQFVTVRNQVARFPALVTGCMLLTFNAEGFIWLSVRFFD